MRKSLIALFCSLCFTIPGNSENAPATNILTPSIYPIRLQNNVYNLCESFPGGLLFKFTGDQNKLNNKKIILELDLPAPVEYVISCGYMPSKVDKFAEFIPDTFTVSKKERGGKIYNHYEITIDQTICKKIGKVQAWNNFDRLYMKAPKGSNGFTGTAFWEFKVGTESCVKGSFVINVQPPIELPDKKCSRFGLAVARTVSLTVPLNEVSDTYINYWTSLQKRPLIFNLPYDKKYSPETLKKISDNFDYAFMEACGQGGSPDLLTAYTRDKKDIAIPLLTDYQDNIVKGRITLASPWYLVKDPDGIVWNNAFSKFAEAIKSNPLKISAIIWDIEPGAKDFCFSQASREEFQKFAGLDSTPTTDEIRKKFADKWFAFRVEQHAKIIKNFSTAMRKFLPELKFILCSDPLHSGKIPVADWCGVDVRLSDDDVDLHMNMPYYTGLQYYNDIELNNKSLKKPNFPLIDPAEDMEYFYAKYSPEKVKQNVIATAALGCIGIGFWPEDIYDGRYLAKIAEAFNMLSDAEDFYANPPSQDFKWKPVNVVKKAFKNEDGSEFELQIPNLQEKVKLLLHKKADEQIVTILNYDNANTAIIKLTFDKTDSQWYTVKEIGSGNIHTENGRNIAGTAIKQGFLIEVKPDDAKIIKISPAPNDKPSAPSDKILSQENLKKKLQVELSGIKTKDDIYNIKQEGNSTISWSARTENNTKTPFLKITGKERFLMIDTKKGLDLIGWENNKKKQDDILVKWGDRGFLGRLIFNDNSQAPVPYDFTLEKTSFDAGIASAALKYRVPPYQGANPLANPLEGLEVTKTVSLTQDGRECRIKFEFQNNNSMKDKIKFGFRINNYPRIGSHISHDKTIAQIGEISFTAADGQAGKIDCTAPVNNLILKKDAVTSWDIKPSPEKWNGGEIIVSAKNMNSSSIVKFVPDTKAVGFYVWRSLKDYTVEFVSQDMELAHGQKEAFEIKIIIEK